MWPGSKLPRKGCANMRSILVALRALVYSRARSKGCWLGSRFRVTFATLEPGACTEAVDRVSVLIFIVGVVDVQLVCSRRRELLACAEISKRQRRGQPTSGGGASRVSVGAGRKN